MAIGARFLRVCPDGNATGAQPNGANALVDLLMVKTANDLAVDMAIKGN